jgi:hypothetical protein
MSLTYLFLLRDTDLLEVIRPPEGELKLKDVLLPVAFVV